MPNLPLNQQQKYSLWFDLREHWVDTRNSDYVIFNNEGLIIKEGKVPKDKIVKLENLETNESLSIYLYDKEGNI